MEPIVEQILGEIKKGKRKGPVHETRTRYGPGYCINNAVLAHEHGGQQWFSSVAHDPGQRYPGRYLCIQELEAERGAVIDCTVDKPLIVYVDTVENPEAVSRQLRKITGFPGWVQINLFRDNE